MFKQLRTFSLIWAAVLVASGVFVAVQLSSPGNINTDLRSISAETNSESATDQLSQQAISAVEARTTRTLAIKIGPGSNRNEIENLVTAVLEKSVAWADNQVAIAHQQQGAEANYFYRWRYQLTIDATLKKLQQLTPPELMQRVVRQLSLPTADKRDWLNIQRSNDHGAQPLVEVENLEIRDGALWSSSADKHTAVVILQLKGSAFSTDTQLQMQQLKKPLAGGSAAFEYYGPAAYASEAAATAKSESMLLGMLSVVAILLLSIGAFRSVIPIVAVLSTVAISALFGLAAVLALFGSMHVITLLLGVSLIGMAADYVFHLVTDWYRHSAQLSIHKVAAAVKPGITLAMLSTCLGYVLLIGVNPQVLSQLAVFTMAGVLAAAFTSFSVLPFGLAKLPAPKLSSKRFPELKLRPLSGVSGGLLLATVGAAGLFSAWHINSNNDPRSFYAKPNLAKGKAQTAQAAAFQNQFLLVKAESEEELLRALGKVEKRLKQARSNGVIERFYSINRYFSEPWQQRQNLKEFGILFQPSSSHWQSTLLALGLDSQVLDKEAKTIQSQAVVTPSIWLKDSSLSHDHDLLLINQTLNKPYAAVVLLAGASSSEQLDQLQRLFAENPAITWVDSLASAEKNLNLTQESLMQRLALAALAVSLLLIWRYKRDAWRVIAVPLVASAAAIVVIGLTGGAFSLFHMAGFLVILALSLDYGVFFAESDAKRQSSTQMAILLSAVTTVFGFGILLFSSTPAVAWFGGTVFVGVIAAVITAFILRKPIADKR